MSEITDIRKHSLDLCIKSMLNLESDLDMDLAESYSTSDIVIMKYKGEEKYNG